MKPARGIGLVQALTDQSDDEVVGDEVAPVVDRLDAPTELGSGGHGSAEHVARGDLGDSALVGESPGLGALAGAWRAEDEEIERHQRAVREVTCSAVTWWRSGVRRGRIYPAPT